MNVAPSGLPKWRSLCREFELLSAVMEDEEDEEEEEESVDEDWFCWSERSDELSRKSWVIAMPIDAKDRDVRSQARNVRSTISYQLWDLACL